MKLLISAIIICLTTLPALAQFPTAKDTGITITEFANVDPFAVKIIYDPISDKLIYATVLGDIYQLDEFGGNAFGTKIFTAEDHGITQLQGMAIQDSLLVLSGNINAYQPLTTGRIAKTILNADLNLTWQVLAETEPYPSTEAFDHLFSGIIITPNADSVIWCAGARGTHGEVHDYGGRYPGLRNGPLNAVLLTVPANAQNFMIQNDTDWLKNNGVLFGEGSRNFFDFAYAPDGTLYAVENSGDRDDPEEMNRIFPGAHYGFPWDMGGNDNPQQFVPFDYTQDLLINPDCRAVSLGLFYEDPTFPARPQVPFVEPVRNFGPDADYYRDETTGEIKQASDDGAFITTFSGHRSPLGFEFALPGMLQDPRFDGKGLMLSWTRGGDENRYVIRDGDTLGVGTFVDKSEDLIVMSPRNGSFNEINCRQTITGFSLPIDLVIARNGLYVMEYDAVQGKIYRVTFSGTSSIAENESAGISLFPNPATDILQLTLPVNSKATEVQIIDVNGKRVQTTTLTSGTNSIDIHYLKTGTYTARINGTKGVSFVKR